ncbi:MAG: Heterosigma akashiwo virus 01 [Bacteroidota bacterium]|jgi:hypothetical protein
MSNLTEFASKFNVPIEEVQNLITSCFEIITDSENVQIENKKSPLKSMEDYFLKTLNPNTARQYTNVITNILNKLEPDNYKIFITHFETISNYLDTLPLSTRAKYANIICKFIPFLESEDEREFIDKYRAIHRFSKTPNPRARPQKGPSSVLVQPRVEVKEDKKLPAKTQRVSKLGTHGLDQNTLDQIEVLSKTFVDKKGNPLDQQTSVLNYKKGLFTICKRYDPTATNLDFLVNDVQGVIDILNSVSIYTGKGYYNSIVRFLPLSKPVELQKPAYDQYYAWLKPKVAAPAQFKEEDYKGYKWPSFVKKVEQIIKKEENDTYKLLLSLFTLQEPRRSADFSFMRVDGIDDNKHNVLVFNKHEKKFIYNYYKNAKKTYSQEVPITNPVLIKRIEAYLNKYKSDVDKKDPNRIQYLFENSKKQPLGKGDIERIMRDDIGKMYNIPSGIRRLRHMYITHVVLDQKNDPRKLKDIAYRLGTSDLMMIRTYADIDNVLKDDDN